MSEFKIIDAHAHLWLRQNTIVEGKEVRTIDRGRSIFLGEVRQMLPPFMIDGRNSAEVFLANMDYAQVSAAVITQEFIDGIQNDYLESVAKMYPDRFFVCGMCDFRLPGFLPKAKMLINKGFRGITIPGHRLPVGKDRVHLNGAEFMEMFDLMEQKGVILSLCLASDDEIQIAEMQEVIKQYPNLKIAIAHFGMPTTEGWKQQVLLARNPNVMVESGGITWLYNDEFYPFPGAIRAIREAADMVGYDHLMWGSDYPRTITAITYRMSYDFVTKSHEIDDDDKAKFLGLNAKKFYGFGELIDLPYIKNMSE